MELIINNKKHEVDVEPGMPILWVLRDELNLTGTKFGCGIASCGACMIHLDGLPVRSCALPASAAVGRRITTIEGISLNEQLSAVQKAWIKHQVPQCGYCQSGMIMAVEGMLATNPNPDEITIENSISNICRCGTYQRIKEAIKDILSENEQSNG